MTVIRDLVAARNLDFRPVLELIYDGDPLPLTDATISMQVRLYAGAPGAASASDPSAEFTDAADADAARRVLTVEPVILRAALAAMPTGLNQPEVGEADRFFYEIKLTYADGLQDSLWTGVFILEPGVDAT